MKSMKTNEIEVFLDLVHKQNEVLDRMSDTLAHMAQEVGSHAKLSNSPIVSVPVTTDAFWAFLVNPKHVVSINRLDPSSFNGNQFMVTIDGESYQGGRLIDALVKTPYFYA